MLCSDRCQGLRLDQTFESSFDDWIDTVPWLNPDSVDWVSDSPYLPWHWSVTNTAGLQTFWDNIISADRL
jgi:hypothetical protein